MKLLDKVFIPESPKKIFDSDKYIKDLEKGLFRDYFNLGIHEKNEGSWLLKDFTKEPNALFVGAMGSGKSMAARYSILTWLLGNSDQTIFFIVDTVKGAQDYRLFFGLNQVYPILSPEGLHRTIDLVYEEAIARKDLFAHVGANSITNYEEKTGKSMARVIVLLEEFHSMTHNVFDFEKQFKNKGTTANKFHTLMRIGRSVGTWFFACSQKSTKSDIPSEVIPNFTQKQIFKVSRAEANYVLGNDMPARLRTDQKGRCYSEFGAIQFPFLDDGSTKKLLDHYIKENKAECARLTPTMIKDVLEGKSTKEQYRHKRLSELAEGFQNFDSQLVITMLHEAIGCEINETFDQDINKFNISNIVTFPQGERVAIMIVTGTKRINEKHLSKLANAINHYKCNKGILYTSADTPSHGLYSKAIESHIEIVDHEDLIFQAKRVEISQEKGFKEEFKPDQLASDDKEQGTYKPKKKKESDVQDTVDDLKDFDELDNLIEDLDIDSEDIEDTERRIYNEEIDDEMFSINDDEDDDVPSNIIGNFDENENSDLEMLNDDEYLFEEENTFDNYFDSGKNLLNQKEEKRPKVSINFNLKEEDNPTLLIKCLRNESGDVYRILTYTVLNNKVINKYYFDRKVEKDFSYSERKILGIDNLDDWNNDSLVLNDEKLKSTIKRFLENFIICENYVFVICWDQDQDFVNHFFIENSTNLIDEPSSFEKQLNTFFSVDYNRDEFIKELNLKVDQNDFFGEIALDYQIWSQTIE